MSELKKYLEKIIDRQNLSREEATRAFQIIMLGGANPTEIAAFIVALRMKGETVDEITGAALVMRSKAGKIQAPLHALDTCGTGGDSSGTFNISTAVAFVVAGCGVPVAKHGNRAVSSKSGSADVLSYLGVNLEIPIEQVEACLKEIGICFMMAPKFHLAMRHVAPIRHELGVRTIFNLLGPVSNPANTEYQLLGVYSDKWTEPLAHVLRELGSQHAWVVHGSDGLDELTTTGPSQVTELKDGVIRTFTLTPEDAGLSRANADDLSGGDVSYNARELTRTLQGKQGAHRDIILLNAAASLLVAGKVNDLRAGVTMAASAIDQGRALQKLDKLIEVTNRTR